MCTYFLILWPLHSSGTTLMNVVLQERMDFLKEDLQHLFDDQGIDKSQYNDRVEFRDPITSYNDVSGDHSPMRFPGRPDAGFMDSFYFM